MRELSLVHIRSGVDVRLDGGVEGCDGDGGRNESLNDNAIEISARKVLSQKNISPVKSMHGTTNSTFLSISDFMYWCRPRQTVRTVMTALMSSTP